MPDGSKMDLLLAKAKPISNSGNSLEAQVVPVSPPPMQLSSPEPPANIRPGGRPLAVSHQQNGDRMA
ncbi:hypothetical protein GRJ2_003062100 [Grus japonensis]|uniref:Uncharacterized protein n=1 Tax=Grus japonensis TaxID=30415 RepID=A0ABC9Y9K2_GRUJA